MRRISDKTGESCSVAVLDDDSIVYVHRMQPKRIYSSALEVGSRLPVHASSLGQAILAHMDREEMRETVSRLSYEHYTDATLTTPDALLAKLEDARKKGCALVEGELETGIISMAVPIFDRRGALVAALNLGALEARTSREQMLGPNLGMLIDGAREIGQTLYF